MSLALTSEPTLRLIVLGLAGASLLWGVARGIGRLFMLAVSLVVGAAAAWAFFTFAPPPLTAWLHGLHAEAVPWAAAACGLIACWYSRRFLAALFRGPRLAPRGLGPRAWAGLFSLGPVLLLLWGAAMALRWSGGVARMHWVDQAALAPSAPDLAELPLLAQLREGLSSGILGPILDRADPLNSRETSALGALLALRRHDAAWQNLLRQPRLAPLLKTDALRPLLQDNDVLRALSFSEYSKLLALPELSETASIPAVRDALRALPIEDAIRAALAGTPALPAAPRAALAE